MPTTISYEAVDTAEDKFSEHDSASSGSKKIFPYRASNINSSQLDAIHRKADGIENLVEASRSRNKSVEAAVELEIPQQRLTQFNFEGIQSHRFAQSGLYLNRKNKLLLCA